MHLPDLDSAYLRNRTLTFIIALRTRYTRRAIGTKMSGARWIAGISLLFPAWCVAVAETPIAVCPISQESLDQMQKRHPLRSVEVDDPVYKRKQRYQGFWLRDLLKALSYAGHPESDVYARFRCKDG